jgi:hypothetical protein
LRLRAARAHISRPLPAASAALAIDTAFVFAHYACAVTYDGRSFVGSNRGMVQPRARALAITLCAHPPCERGSCGRETLRQHLPFGSLP